MSVAARDPCPFRVRHNGRGSTGRDGGRNHTARPERGSVASVVRTIPVSDVFIDDKVFVELDAIVAVQALDGECGMAFLRDGRTLVLGYSAPALLARLREAGRGNETGTRNLMRDVTDDSDEEVDLLDSPNAPDHGAARKSYEYRTDPKRGSRASG